MSLSQINTSDEELTFEMHKTLVELNSENTGLSNRLMSWKSLSKVQYKYGLQTDQTWEIARR